MAVKYAQDELNKCSRQELIHIVLQQQSQLEKLNDNLEKLIEQIRIANQERFGRKSERMDVIDGQLSFFDEADSLADNSVPEPEPAAAEPAEEVSPETPAADASSDAIPVIPAVPVETVSDFDKQPDVPKEPPIPDEDLIIPETEEEMPSSETLSSEPAAVGEPILEDDDVEIISEDEVELDSVFDRKS